MNVTPHARNALVLARSGLENGSHLDTHIAANGPTLGEVIDRGLAELEHVSSPPDFKEAVSILADVVDYLAAVLDGPMIAGAGVKFVNGVEGIPTIARARKFLVRYPR
jgi:hypothetical protein